jgi:hypothetical protein
MRSFEVKNPVDRRKDVNRDYPGSGVGHRQNLFLP